MRPMTLFLKLCFSVLPLEEQSFEPDLPHKMRLLVTCVNIFSSFYFALSLQLSNIWYFPYWKPFQIMRQGFSACSVDMKSYEGDIRYQRVAVAVISYSLFLFVPSYCCRRVFSVPSLCFIFMSAYTNRNKVLFSMLLFLWLLILKSQRVQVSRVTDAAFVGLANAGPRFAWIMECWKR